MMKYHFYKHNYLKSHLFRLRAKLFVVEAAAKLAGNRGKITIINGRDEGGIEPPYAHSHTSEVDFLITCAFFCSAETMSPDRPRSAVPAATHIILIAIFILTSILVITLTFIVIVITNEIANTTLAKKPRVLSKKPPTYELGINDNII